MPKSPIAFRGFDKHGEVRIYEHGILPHWRQRGCTYFVTFRLADSIPAPVLQALESERVVWLKAHGIQSDDPGWKYQLAKLPFIQRKQYEQIIAGLLNKSLDECHGSCVLRDRAIGKQVACALDYFHNQRVMARDFIIMPNHVHALITPINNYELEDIMHSIKSYTANEINHALNRRGPLWQRER